MQDKYQNTHFMIISVTIYQFEKYNLFNSIAKAVGLILDVLISVVFYILVYWLILDVLILVVFNTLVYWLIKVT
jgi:hypothetical protein